MAFHHHDGSVWVETLDHIHDGSLWTDDNDEIYIHDGAAWVLIQPDGAVPPPPPDDFPPPFNLAVDTLTDSAVKVTWELPVSSPTPTEVQFRVLEVSTIFDVLEYPATSGSHQALAPATTYTFQVRLVHRTLGVPDVYSTIAEIGFTTTETTVPLGPVVDPGGTGGDSLFVPPVIGGTAFPGTPGPVDGTDCWWQWKVETWLDGSWQAMSPPQTGAYAGTVHVHPYDLATLPSPGTYRYAIREVCNGTPGPYNYGSPFSPTTDWADPCADSPLSWDFTNTGDAYTDALFYIPQVCTPSVIHDAVSGDALTHAAGYSGTFITSDDSFGNWQIGSLLSYGDGSASKGVVQGDVSPVADLVPGDFSVSFKLNIGTVPIGARTLLLSLGGNAIVFVAKSAVGGTRYSLAVEAYTTAGLVNLEAVSPTAIFPDVDYKVTLRWDEDGPKQLFINGTQEALNLAGDAFAGGSITAQTIAYLPPDSRIWSIAGWNRLLTDDEISYTSAGRALLLSMVGWWDARDYSGSGSLLNKGTTGAAIDAALGAGSAAPSFSVDHFVFDGVDDYMAIPDNAALDFANADEFTVGVIVKFTTVPLTSGALLNKYDNSNGPLPGYYIVSTGTTYGVTTGISDTGGQFTNVASPVSAVNAKTLFAMTRDGGLIFATRDDTDNNSADTTTMTSANAQTLLVGKTPTNTNFQHFQLFGIFVSRTALIGSEILSILSEYGI